MYVYKSDKLAVTDVKFGMKQIAATLPPSAVVIASCSFD